MVPVKSEPWLSQLLGGCACLGGDDQDEGTTSIYHPPLNSSRLGFL